MNKCSKCGQNEVTADVLVCAACRLPTAQETGGTDQHDAPQVEELADRLEVDGEILLLLGDGTPRKLFEVCGAIRSRAKDSSRHVPSTSDVRDAIVRLRKSKSVITLFTIRSKRSVYQKTTPKKKRNREPNSTYEDREEPLGYVDSLPSSSFGSHRKVSRYRKLFDALLADDTGRWAKVETFSSSREACRFSSSFRSLAKRRGIEVCTRGGDVFARKKVEEADR